MPATSLFLVSLQPTTQIATFVPDLVSSASPQPVLIARPLRWIINPWMTNASQHKKSSIEKLTSTTWDLLVIFPTTVSLPPSVTSHIRATYTLNAGISSKLLATFATTNSQLLHAVNAPPLTGSLDKDATASSSKDLELTPELRAWFSQASTPRTPVSMLNLLAFHEGKLESYKAYGRAFATDVGKRRGGVAKIVGTVLGDRDKVWDEVAVAHYPTVWHFADMVVSDDYQEVNTRHRVGALRGTAILCCDELDPEVQKGWRNAAAQKAKI